MALDLKALTEQPNIVLPLKHLEQLLNLYWPYGRNIKALLVHNNIMILTASVSTCGSLSNAVELFQIIFISSLLNIRLLFFPYCIENDHPSNPKYWFSLSCDIFMRNPCPCQCEYARQSSYSQLHNQMAGVAAFPQQALK